MAASGISSEWLTNSRGDTRKAVAFAATGRVPRIESDRPNKVVHRSNCAQCIGSQTKRELAKMRQILINMTTLPLWASPNSSVYDMMLRSEDRSAVRRDSSNMENAESMLCEKILQACQ